MEQQIGQLESEATKQATRVNCSGSDARMQPKDTFLDPQTELVDRRTEVGAMQMDLCNLFGVEHKEVAFAFDSHGLKESWNDENLCADALRFLKKGASQVCV